MKYTRNAARCKCCGDVIESRHVHDFVSCKCGAIFVDGGLEYLRRGAKDLNLIEDLSENISDKLSKIISKFVNRPVRCKDHTIEIFCADAKEQLVLLRELRLLCQLFELFMGRPPAFIFHSRAESQRLYKDFVDNWQNKSERENV